MPADILVPQWAFCHTRSVKSRTFRRRTSEETAIPLDLRLFVIEITAVQRWGIRRKALYR